jgi:hypothetical protein
MSITTLPASLAALAAAKSRAAANGSARTMTLLASAAAAVAPMASPSGLLALRSLASSVALTGSWSTTVTEFPPARRRVPMPRAILPAPMMLMFMMITPLAAALCAGHARHMTSRREYDNPSQQRMISYW